MKQQSLQLPIRQAIALCPCLLTGCARAPSFDIWGSLFPAWLLCLILGVLITVLIRWWFLRLEIAITLPILVYPSLTALITFLLWLVFFS